METPVIEATIETQIAVSLDAPPLLVSVKREQGGAELTRERVTKADLLDAISELWRETCLRKGRPAVALADVSVRLLLTLKSPTSHRCSSYALELTRPDGCKFQREFSLKSFNSVALRAAHRFLDAATIENNSSVFYELLYVPSESPAARATGPAAVREGAVKTQPLTFLTVPVRPLMEAATPKGELDEEALPVFYLNAAFDKAERFARKGAALNPPVETGAVLIGSLCSCPDTGEFFAVVTDAWEVQDAEESEFSLAFTGKSWMRIQTVLRARQAAQAGCTDRIVGQTHGHNFLPNGGKICETCPKLPVCNLSNLFVSQDDQKWSRAVFAKQPWALCHIFGLTARGDKVQSLYTVKDARLQPRGFFLLEDFSPEQWKSNHRRGAS
jgi:hypothetical protein